MITWRANTAWTKHQCIYKKGRANIRPQKKIRISLQFHLWYAGLPLSSSPKYSTAWQTRHTVSLQNHIRRAEMIIAKVNISFISPETVQGPFNSNYNARGDPKAPSKVTNNPKGRYIFPKSITPGDWTQEFTLTAKHRSEDWWGGAMSKTFQWDVYSDLWGPCMLLINKIKGLLSSREFCLVRLQYGKDLK